jgi:putative hemolysin
MNEVSFGFIAVRILLFLISFLGVGVFAGCETAFLAADEWAVERMAEEGHKSALVLKALSHDKKHAISALLIGTNIFTVLASVMSSTIASSLNVTGFTGFVVVPLMTASILFVFSELVPKSYATSRPTEIALSIAPYLALATRVLRPVSLLLSLVPTCLAWLLKKGLGKQGSTQQGDDTDSAVRVALDMAGEDGYVSPDETEVIYGVLDSSDKSVGDIMVSMKDVVYVTSETTLKSTMKLFHTCHFSRVPVLSKDRSRVMGIVYIKDVMRQMVVFDANESELVSKVWRVPYTVSVKDNVLDVLSKLRTARVHLAIVLEGNKPVGIVTMDDILEEILGDIPEDLPRKPAGVRNLAASLGDG